MEGILEVVVFNVFTLPDVKTLEKTIYYFVPQKVDNVLDDVNVKEQDFQDNNEVTVVIQKKVLPDLKN